MDKDKDGSYTFRTLPVSILARRTERAHHRRYPRYVSLATHANLRIQSLHARAEHPHNSLTPIFAGIGAACALALAEAGASICLVQRPGSANTATRDAIAALGRRVAVVEADLGDMDAVKGVFPRALAAMDGAVDVLVNCGGIQRRAPAVEFSEEDWDEVRWFCFWERRGAVC